MTAISPAMGEAAPPPETAPPRARRRESVFRRALRSTRFDVGLAIVSVFVLVAIFGPLFVRNAASLSAHALRPPSSHFLLGTTQTGENVLSQLIVGTRSSLEVGALAAAIATVISILVGVGGAYLGGRADEALSLASNIFLVIPALPLVIVITAYLKTNSLMPLVVVIGLTGWAASARVLRAQTLSVRSRDYILAARASGEKQWRIVLVEILPNVLPIIVSQVLFSIIFAILTEAGLAFLGLGNLNTISWGSMLYFAENGLALSEGAWWWFVPPGLCIALLGAGLALMNFGLDEVINPRLRRAGRGGR